MMGKRSRQLVIEYLKYNAMQAGGSLCATTPIADGAIARAP